MLDDSSRSALIPALFGDVKDPAEATPSKSDAFDRARWYAHQLQDTLSVALILGGRLAQEAGNDVMLQLADSGNGTGRVTFAPRPEPTGVVPGDAE